MSVSKQRREAALEVRRLLMDPKFRAEAAELGDDGPRPVIIALWNDELGPLLRRVEEYGGAAHLCIKRPGGQRGLVTMAVRGFSEPPANEDEEETVTAAPASTIGMLLDSVARRESFNLKLEESPLGRHFELARASH